VLSAAIAMAVSPAMAADTDLPTAVSSSPYFLISLR